MPDFSSISPHLDVRISPRARRLALRLDTSRRKVCLVIPKRASLKNAYLFAYENRAWIQSKIESIPSGIPLCDGAVIPLLGREVTIRIERDDAYRLTDIKLENDVLSVKTRLEDIEPRILRFIKKLAAEEFLRMAQMKAALIGRKVENLTLRDMKTRWGSCSTDGRMALSWRLIFAPYEAYEYVISHEVAHLSHPNHGDRFWSLCEELSADFSTGHAWMRDHGTQLMRFGRN